MSDPVPQDVRMTKTCAAPRISGSQGSSRTCRPAVAGSSLATPRPCRPGLRYGANTFVGPTRGQMLSEYLIASLAVFALLCATLL
ncbi:MAG: hypothetical protein J0L84_01685 [Verrucomicrobia bacterium]|nr:hypothetical protein [Verrucomicrobiota bacterium]